MSELEHQDVKSYPSLGQSWGLFGFTLLATVVVAILVAVVYLVLLAIGRESVATVLLTSAFSKLVMYALPFVIVIWLALRKKKSVELDFQFNFSATSLITMLLIVLATWSIYFLIDPVVDLIPMPKFFENLMLQLLSDHGVWSILMLVAAAPICEELLFRGIILDGLLKRYSPTKAIIWSAVLFGLVHLNPWQLLAAFTLGAFMGWIYYRTGSVLVTMFIHFVANGTGVLLGWLLVPDPTQMVTTREMVGSNVLYFGLLAANALLLVVLLSSLKKQFAKSA
jgi:uncharacterized protein